MVNQRSLPQAKCRHGRVRSGQMMVVVLLCHYLVLMWFKPGIWILLSKCDIVQDITSVDIGCIESCPEIQQVMYFYYYVSGRIHTVRALLCFSGIGADQFYTYYSGMMTSSNGKIFRVTGHLCREFTDPRWIPHTKASDAELWCFLWSASE